MNNRTENWEKTGLLENTPEIRKEFVVNVLELALIYALHRDKEEINDQYKTLLFPIIKRIGDEVDFGINEFFNIINEIREGVNNLVSSGYVLEDEMIFVETYSNNKIKKLKEVFRKKGLRNILENLGNDTECPINHAFELGS